MCRLFRLDWLDPFLRFPVPLFPVSRFHLPILSCRVVLYISNLWQLFTVGVIWQLGIVIRCIYAAACDTSGNLELSIRLTCQNHCSLCCFQSVSPFDLNPAWWLYFSSVFCLCHLVLSTIPFVPQVFYDYLLFWESTILLYTEILTERKLRINCYLFGLLHVYLSTFSSKFATVNTPSKFYFEYLFGTIHIW